MRNPFRHPFKNEPLSHDTCKIFPDYVDGVEVINAGVKKEINCFALEYAEKYNLIKFGGSDAHVATPQEGGIAFAGKPESIGEIIDMVQKNEHVVLGEKYFERTILC